MLSRTAILERLEGLNEANGGVYTTADLEVLVERPHPSRVTEVIALLMKEGVLLRIRRGLYADRLRGYRPEIAGLRWVSPSYLSTETALDRQGLCQTGILDFTYVTTRLIARREQAVRSMEGRRFVYRHLARHLFFGYQPVEGGLVAEPEKAALDFLYFYYKKQRSVITPKDIDFSRLDRVRYTHHLTAYRQAGFEAFALGWLGGGE